MTHGELMDEHNVMERLADIDSPQMQRLLEDADRSARFDALPFHLQQALVLGTYKSCLKYDCDGDLLPPEDDDDDSDGEADVDPGACGAD